MRVRYLTYREAAAQASCHPVHLRRAVQKHEIEVRKVGHRTFLHPDSFRRWLDKYKLVRRIHPAAPIFDEAAATSK